MIDSYFIVPRDLTVEWDSFTLMGQIDFMYKSFVSKPQILKAFILPGRVKYNARLRRKDPPVPQVVTSTDTRYDHQDTVSLDLLRRFIDQLSRPGMPCKFYKERNVEFAFQLQRTKLSSETISDGKYRTEWYVGSKLNKATDSVPLLVRLMWHSGMIKDLQRMLQMMLKATECHFRWSGALRDPDATDDMVAINIRGNLAIIRKFMKTELQWKRPVDYLGPIVSELVDNREMLRAVTKEFKKLFPGESFAKAKTIAMYVEDVVPVRTVRRSKYLDNSIDALVHDLITF